MNSLNPLLSLSPTSSPPSPPPSPNRQRPDDAPAVVLSPLAFLKLQFFLHAGDTEVGGFGVSRSPDDLLYVEDFVTVSQSTTCVTVDFDDAAVADHFDQMDDAGKPPAECGRIWMHTHPGSGPDPSGTDERTFARAFGHCDWSVMFIVARGGRTYARLQFAAGPRASVLLPVRVDWAAWATTLADLGGEHLGELAEAWMDEYGRNVRPVMEYPLRPGSGRLFGSDLDFGALVAAAPRVVSNVRLAGDPDRIADPDADWWDAAEELTALAEMEAADYWADGGGGFRDGDEGVFG
jgi:hypothetical protein